MTTQQELDVAYLNGLDYSETGDSFSGIERLWIGPDRIVVAVGTYDHASTVQFIQPGTKVRIAQGPDASVLMGCGRFEWIGDYTIYVQPIVMFVGDNCDFHETWRTLLDPMVKPVCYKSKTDALLAIGWRTNVVVVLVSDQNMGQHPQTRAIEVARLLAQLQEAGYKGIVHTQSDEEDAVRVSMRPYLALASLLSQVPFAANSSKWPNGQDPTWII